MCLENTERSMKYVFVSWIVVLWPTTSLALLVTAAYFSWPDLLLQCILIL